jgi:hypothetical protein
MRGRGLVVQVTFCLICMLLHAFFATNLAASRASLVFLVVGGRCWRLLVIPCLSDRWDLEHCKRNRAISDQTY